MFDEIYEGFINYETYCVALWIAHEEGYRTLWQDNAKNATAQIEEEFPNLKSQPARLRQVATGLLAINLADWVDQENPFLDQRHMFADLLDSALRGVCFGEIAERIMSGEINELKEKQTA